jgi:hypothetical protein
MRFISVAAVAALPLLVAACSLAPSAGTSKPTGAAAASATANPDAGLMTGTQLKARLVAAGQFPAGFTLDPTGSVDSGDTYQLPSPAAGAPDCTRLDATSWEAQAGVGSVSFAENDYIDNDTSEQYAQEIDVFRGASAQAAMAGLRKLASTCPSFHDAQTSSTVTVKLANGPALGDDALTFTLDSPQWAGGTTLEAVRVGTAVVTVLYSAASGTGAAQATDLATAITKNLKSKD